MKSKKKKARGRNSREIYGAALDLEINENQKDPRFAPQPEKSVFKKRAKSLRIEKEQCLFD